jgi:hypothetical protein
MRDDAVQEFDEFDTAADARFADRGRPGLRVSGEQVRRRFLWPRQVGESSAEQSVTRAAAAQGEPHVERTGGDTQGERRGVA